MDPQTQAQTGDDLGIMTPFTVMLPTPPTVPSGEEMYDAIMGPIEPELTSKMLPTLKKKYAEETPAQSQERQERYKRAYAEYEVKMKEYMANAQSQITHYERQTLELRETVSSYDDAGTLQTISSAMSNS